MVPMEVFERRYFSAFSAGLKDTHNLWTNGHFIFLSYLTSYNSVI